MVSLNATKLILAAAGIALLATPALAQRLNRRPPRVVFDYRVPPGDPLGVYPNPVARTGTAAQARSGAAFDLDRGY
jgi:hypothetical protein